MASNAEAEVGNVGVHVGEGKEDADELEEALCACRGVTHGMGIQLMSVEVEKKKPGETRKAHRSLMTKSRKQENQRMEKIESVAQTLADRLWLAGYILRKVDLRRMKEEEVKNMEWRMRVTVIEE